MVVATNILTITMSIFPQSEPLYSYIIFLQYRKAVVE
jgi:hypothetical protein